jgi:hypothetical protein
MQLVLSQASKLSVGRGFWRKGGYQIFYKGWLLFFVIVSSPPLSRVLQIMNVTEALGLQLSWNS